MINRLTEVYRRFSPQPATFRRRLVHHAVTAAEAGTAVIVKPATITAAETDMMKVTIQHSMKQAGNCSDCP